MIDSIREKAEALAGPHVRELGEVCGSQALCTCVWQYRVKRIEEALREEADTARKETAILEAEIRGAEARATVAEVALREAGDAWRREAMNWDHEVAEFGHPIAPDHPHHAVRDWLNDAFKAGQQEAAAKTYSEITEQVRVDAHRRGQEAMQVRAADCVHGALSRERAIEAIRALPLEEP